MTQYRLVILPLRTPKGPWRDSRSEAVDDAIAQGLAERDEHDRQRVWWHPLAELERSEP